MAIATVDGRLDAPGIDPLDLVDPARYARNGYPHAVWTRLRAEAPVAHFAPPGYRPFWAITKHADIVQISSQPLRFSSAQGIMLRPRRCAADAAVGDGRHARSAAARAHAPGRERALHAARAAGAARGHRAHRGRDPRPGGDRGRRRASATSSSASPRRSRSRWSPGSSACRATTGGCCSAGPTR